jgi:hypothetical protein
VLSNLSATATSPGSSRPVAAVFIAGFVLLAFAFSVLASRALQGQLGRFLEARSDPPARFLLADPNAGHDEFAALGAEFNSMSSQFANRLHEISQKRARVQESIRRIGQTLRPTSIVRCCSSWRSGRPSTRSMRATVASARYGGDEMAVILPHTDLDGSRAIAEGIRKRRSRRYASLGWISKESCVSSQAWASWRPTR